MCGIAGAFRLDGGRAPAARQRRPARDDRADRAPRPRRRRLRARRRRSLGARRLSIIDVEGGHQPFCERARPHLGRPERRDLQPRRAARRAARRRPHAALRCDTEVLPHLYEEHGAGARRPPARHVRRRRLGPRPRRGVLVRDRLGIKPLYYAIVDDVVVFGSELKSVIASGLVDDELDPEAIAAYLTLGFVPGPMTPLRDVRKLMPGERLVIEDGERAARALLELPGARPRDPAAQRRRVGRDRAATSSRSPCEMRLMSDVPLGAMLSGGLDSSLIVALMARAHGPAGQDLRRRLRRRGLRAAATPAASPTLNGADHHELEVDADDRPGRRSSDARLAPRRAARGPLRRSASSRSASWPLEARHRRALGPGRRRAARRLPQAPRRLAGRALGRACPGPLRAAAAGRRLPPRPGRAPAACSTRSQAPIPSSRLLASSGLVHPDLQGRAVRTARSPSTPTPPSRAMRGHLAGAPGAAPLEARAVPGRPARPRRRHAHLLRPRVDGVLARGPRAVPRPRVRRAVRPHARPTVKVRRLQGKHVLRRARQGPRPGLRARQAQAAASSTSRSARGSERRRRRRRAACCSAPTPRYARGRRPRRGRARRDASSAPAHGAPRAAAARADHARDCGSASTCRAPSPPPASPSGPQRERCAALRRRHPGAQRGREPAAARRGARRARRCPPARGSIVDDGSDRRHRDRARRRSRAEHPWVAASSTPAPAPRAALADGPPRGPRPARRLPRRASSACRARRRRGQGRRRRLLRPGLLRAAASARFAADPQLGDRERHVLRARGRRVGPPHEVRRAPCGAPRAPTAGAASTT